MGAEAPESLPCQPGLEVRPRALKRFYDARHPPFERSQAQSHQHSLVARFGPDFIIRLLLALLVVMTLATAAVAGILGTTISSYEHKSRTPDTGATSCSSSLSSSSSAAAAATASPTSIALLQDYVPINTSTIDSLHNDCDPNKTITNIWGDTYVPVCGREIEEGLDSKEAKGHVADILSIVAYSFMDCMSACSSLSSRAKHYDFPNQCHSFTFKANIKNATAKYYANCFLKNSTMTEIDKARVNPFASSARRINNVGSTKLI